MEEVTLVQLIELAKQNKRFKAYMKHNTYAYYPHHFRSVSFPADWLLTPWRVEFINERTSETVTLGSSFWNDELLTVALREMRFKQETREALRGKAIKVTIEEAN
jgi:hypothetical protein